MPKTKNPVTREMVNLAQVNIGALKNGIKYIAHRKDEYYGIMQTVTDLRWHQGNPQAKIVGGDSWFTIDKLRIG